MSEGAPDYVHLRQILAKDALGNLVPVACDPSGRIILLPYGTMNVDGAVNIGNIPGDYLTEGGDVGVDQNAVERTIQGADGLTLHTIAVDSEGRLIMLPYGWDGATYRKLKVDDEGRMIGVMKGQADVKWGLRGWWKFVASEGTTIKDYSGYGNNGVARSGGAEVAVYGDGIIGQSLYFDGSNDFVKILHDASLNFTTEDFTFEFWINPLEFAADRYIIIKGWYHIDGWSVFLTAGNLMYVRTCQAAETQQSISSEITQNVWTHVCIVRVGADITIYFNSVDVTDTHGEHIDPVTNTRNIHIGIHDNEALGPYKGYLDEVRIYGRALSVEEIAWRYANTNPAVGKPTRMIAVDSEGRMRVNIEDMPYKEQILISEFIKSTAGASTIQVESDPVPDGKIWVVGSCMLSHDTDNITTLKIGIKRGAVVYPFNETLGAGNNDNLTIHAPLYLKAGDKLWSLCFPVANNIYCWVRGNGYELNAD